ncbi:hypothetical protein [Agromyces humi]|uniref:hypothetical protein n=1 Tax=Agromyces humi TaxID=1766800 RepID=UPI00135AF124|nr:hypothetical protein [Agromyces humi]
MNEEEIVELAGDLACSSCFPSAPVVDRRNPRPNQLETPEGRADREKREAEKDARAKAKAEREAKQAAAAINTPDGEPIYDSYRRPFKNERTAESEAIGKLENAIYWDGVAGDHEYARVVGEVLAGLAHKRGIDQAELRTTWIEKTIKKTKSQPNRTAAEFRMGKIFDAADAYLAKKGELKYALDSAAGAETYEAAKIAWEEHIGARKHPSSRY